MVGLQEAEVPGIGLFALVSLTHEDRGKLNHGSLYFGIGKHLIDRQNLKIWGDVITGVKLYHV